MKVKTSELIGPALNWAVAKCEGLNPNIDPEVRVQYVGYPGFAEANGFGYAIKNYSTDWAQGGPIIDNIKGFLFKQWLESKPESCCEAHIHNYDGDWIQFGQTPLIAAMRCYVASKFGDFVEVPDELAN